MIGKLAHRWIMAISDINITEMQINYESAHIQCDFFKMLTHDFLINHALDQNSEGTLCSSTFSWLHCDEISAQNSNVYVQENFFVTF